LLTVLATPLLLRYGRSRRLRGFIRGITVTVVGVLVGTTFLVGRTAITDWPTAAVAVLTLASLFLWKGLPDGGRGGARPAVEQEAHERGGDDHRAGRDHADRHRIEELAVIEPVVLIDDVGLEERHDHQPAAKDQHPGLEEEPEDLCRQRRDPPDDRGGRRQGRELVGRGPRRGSGLQGRGGAGRGRREEHSAQRSGDQEEHRQLAFDHDRDDAGQGEEQPCQPVAAQRLAPEVPAGLEDQRDDHRRDAIEQGADLPGVAEPDVGPGGGGDQQVGRQGEGGRGGEAAGHAVADVAAVHPELIGERPGACRGDRQAVVVLGLGEPAALLDQVAAHGVGEGDGAAEAERSQAQEVARQRPQRGRRRRSGDRERLCHRLVPAGLSVPLDGGR
jgi:hypothetical protein